MVVEETCQEWHVGSLIASFCFLLDSFVVRVLCFLVLFVHVTHWCVSIYAQLLFHKRKNSRLSVECVSIAVDKKMMNMDGSAGENTLGLGQGDDQQMITLADRENCIARL